MKQDARVKERSAGREGLSILPIEEVAFPPFEGFPRQGMDFLKRLKRNNNRRWFQNHKQEYEDNVRFPMQCLVATLARTMADIAPEIEFNPRRSIFRIYRDVRFSSNKAPYKTNIAASFRVRGIKGALEGPGLYLGIEPGEIYVGGGVYMPAGEQLKAIRTAMIERPDDFLSIVESKRFRKEFGEIEGEKLRRAPLGIPEDHPMIEHLRHKQFYIGKVLPDSACHKSAFAEQVTSVFADTMPLVRWLQKALS